jgi:septum formation protein
MLLNKIKDYRIILASASPRRRELLKGIGIEYVCEPNGCEDESYGEEVPTLQVSSYIADKKSLLFGRELQNNEILITADTIVICGDKILGKPADYKEAVDMLTFLSGKTHTVSTGVCIRSNIKKRIFNIVTEVKFRTLSPEEIYYYIDNYKPYDKAGAYGAQEWIGYVAIERIEGSYFNVMGFPVHSLYLELENFIR